MSVELFVSRRGRQYWTALREDGRVVELRVEESDGPEVGRVVKARVTNVVTGIQSAFLDLGTERDGFLHGADLWLPGDKPKTSEIPIQDRLKEGREIVVQIVRGSIGSKGARVTSYLNIPGRLLVLLPRVPVRGVSRKISDVAERQRLQKLVDELPDREVGFVARTAAVEATDAALAKEAERLVEMWREIESNVDSLPAPATLLQERDLLHRLLIDAPPDGYDRIVVDEIADREHVARVLQRSAIVPPEGLELHTGPVPLFEAEGLDAELEKAVRGKVWLKSGGYLVIEPTEALISIDVNTGKFIHKRKLEETVRRTNLEAVDEIARQLRLRDLGGIVVIDFVDMNEEESKRQVLEAMTRELARDPARTHVVGLSPLGLLQLTRKRTRPGPGRLLTRPCPACAGRGRLRGARMVAAQALAELRSRHAGDPTDPPRIRAGGDVLEALAELDPGLAYEPVPDESVGLDRYLFER